MSSDNDVRSHQRHRPLRIFFFLSLIFLLVAGVSAFIWLLLPTGATATALFQVARSTPTILGNEAVLPPEAYETLKKTQLALLRSEFVLTTAVRDRGVASLSTFAGVADPVEWLQQHLRVEYPPGWRDSID